MVLSRGLRNDRNPQLSGAKRTYLLAKISSNLRPPKLERRRARNFSGSTFRILPPALKGAFFAQLVQCRAVIPCVSKASMTPSKISATPIAETKNPTIRVIASMPIAPSLLESLLAYARHR